MNNSKYSNDNQYDPVRAAHIVGEAEGYDAGYQAGIDAAIAALPEKKDLKTDIEDDSMLPDDDPRRFCLECGQYDFEGQLNCPCTGFNRAIDQMEANLKALTGGDDEL